MKTFQPKAKEVKRDWHLLDAKDQVVGRFATRVAELLMGKGKVTFSKHMDSGDFVVVTNVEKVMLTGKKEKQKLYRRHSGYPGGYKEETAREVREKHPERILEKAVFGMLPDNKLRADRMVRLKLVVGEKNPYESNFKK